MCKAPLSAIGVTQKRKPLCFPRTHLNTQPLQPWGSRALSEGSDKLFCTHFLGNKALKSGTHTFLLLNMILCPCELRNSWNSLLYPLWGPHRQGEHRSKAGSSAGQAGGAQVLHKANQDSKHDKGNLSQVRSLVILLSHASGYYRPCNTPRFNTQTV